MFYIYTPRKGQKTSGGIEMEYWLEIVQGCVCPIGVAMLSFSRYLYLVVTYAVLNSKQNSYLENTKFSWRYVHKSW